MTDQRLRSLLGALLCVVVAAVGLQVSDTSEGLHYVKGPVAEPLAISDGEVSAANVRVGIALGDAEELEYRTAGMLVMVDVTGAATGRQELRLNKAELRTEDRVYAELRATTITAAPGFATRQALVFEVDPTAIDDLTLQVWRSEIVFGYAQRARVHLGITASNAEQWRAAARDQVLDPPPPDSRVIP